MCGTGRWELFGKRLFKEEADMLSVLARVIDIAMVVTGR